MTMDREGLTRLVNERIGGLSDAAAILGITDSALSMRVVRESLPEDLMPLSTDDTNKPRVFDLDAYRRHANESAKSE